MDDELSQPLQLAQHYHQQGLLEQAEQLYRQILRDNTKEAEALFGLGLIAYQYQYPDAAEQLFLKAIQAKPRRARYYLALGNVFFSQNRLLSAIATYEHALQLEPSHPEVLHNIAQAYEQKNEQDIAFERYLQAISTHPEQAVSHLALAQLYQERDEPHRAAHHFEEATRHQPNLFEAWRNLAQIYFSQGYMQMGLHYLQQAVRQTDCDTFTAASYLYYLQFTENLEPRELLSQCQQWYRQFVWPEIKPRTTWANRPDPQRCLKIAYILDDLTGNNGASLLSVLLQHHDTQAFHLSILYDGHRFDDVTQWFQHMADHWEAIYNLTDEQVGELVITQNIDILIHLQSFKPHRRWRLYAQKPAPIQISGWLMDYPSGLPTMDAHISGHSWIAEFQAEPTLRLTQPWCWHPPKSVAELPLVAPPVMWRDRVVFGYCGEHVRINPTVLKVWADILHELPQAYLHIRLGEDDHPAFIQVYEHYLGQYGIGRERLDFSVRATPLTAMAFYATVDISLAPFPSSDVVTACESLWMGTPIVAMGTGNQAVASLLKQVGLDQWIAASPQAYVACAVELAREPQALATGRQQLRQHLKASSLCDTTAYMQQLEHHYRHLWQQWCIKRAAPPPGPSKLKRR